jgi:hypothetical protein
MACGDCAASMAGRFSAMVAKIENKVLGGVQQPQATQSLSSPSGNVFGDPTQVVTRDIRNGTNPVS